MKSGEFGMSTHGREGRARAPESGVNEHDGGEPEMTGLFTRRLRPHRQKHNRPHVRVYAKRDLSASAEYSLPRASKSARGK